MFNKFSWDNYLKAGGEKVVETFEKNLLNEYTTEYADFVADLHREYCLSENIVSGTREQLIELHPTIMEESVFDPEGEYTILSALEYVYDSINENNGGSLSQAQVFDIFTSKMEFFTTFFASEFPEVFVPYYFFGNFNIVKKIAEEFEIDLPPIPAKKNYKERMMYYGEICAALYEFRTEHDLTPYELCAFLYDFAPKYIGGKDSYIIKDLPAPSSAYFIGGSKDDFFVSDDVDTVALWQCSPETKAGDMIVMYLRTPISAIDSVWRSVSIGFNDPFFYYYRCTYIGQPKPIKRISQKQLKADKILGELPIVKKNMQGINGVELRPSAYHRILDIAESDVLRLEFDEISDDSDFKIEKDVENKLIKPLIAKLGYGEGEWESQLHLEVGNHNFKLIPDFVLMPNRTKGHQTAFAIIEAKLTIENNAILDEVKIQARSYACQLRSKYAVIAAKEKVWVISDKDDYTNVIFSATWAQLNDPDVFTELRRIIGKK